MYLCMYVCMYVYLVTHFLFKFQNTHCTDIKKKNYTFICSLEKLVSLI